MISTKMQKKEDEQNAIDARIKLLEGEIEEQENVAEFIKALLKDDPRNSEMIEGAGIKLNDSIDVISTKFSEWLAKNPSFGEKETGAGTSFTSTERKKLEAAGLLNAPRDQQLKFLFPQDDDDGLTDDEKEFKQDLKEQRRFLAESLLGGEPDLDAWGIAWNTMKGQYPDISNETLDELLDKDKYFPR